MSIDSLTSLTANVPDWLRRLDDLNEQIEQRQLDLAKFDEQNSVSTRSLRNRGSTESLKPKDDGAAFPHDDDTPVMTAASPSTSQNGAHQAGTPQQRPQSQPQPQCQPDPQPQSLVQSHSQPEPRPKAAPTAQAGESQTPVNGLAEPASATSPTSQVQKQEVIAAAQLRARATLRKRQKTESMISVQGGVSSYRSRTMVIVYYDSYVQSFFEELVKFVSASRNLMRKAKMAAKVAQIKRMAELEMPDNVDDDSEDELKPGDLTITADPKSTNKPNGADKTTPRYPGAQQMGLLPRHPSSGRYMRGTRPGASSALSGGLSLFSQKGDVYDDLDKGLEFVQGMCERAAHQFLRDGDCDEEIVKIKARLEQTRELAAKELQCALKENPALFEESETPKNRSYRPTSMRRDTDDEDDGQD
jgi:hypothetical protein